jgi:hypothetical protein
MCSSNYIIKFLFLKNLEKLPKVKWVYELGLRSNVEFQITEFQNVKRYVLHSCRHDKKSTWQKV